MTDLHTLLRDALGEELPEFDEAGLRQRITRRGRRRRAAWGACCVAVLGSVGFAAVQLTGHDQGEQVGVAGPAPIETFHTASGEIVDGDEVVYGDVTFAVPVTWPELDASRCDGGTNLKGYYLLPARHRRELSGGCPALLPEHWDTRDTVLFHLLPFSDAPRDVPVEAEPFTTDSGLQGFSWPNGERLTEFYFPSAHLYVEAYESVRPEIDPIDVVRSLRLTGPSTSSDLDCPGGGQVHLTRTRYTRDAGWASPAEALAHYGGVPGEGWDEVWQSVRGALWIRRVDGTVQARASFRTTESGWVLSPLETCGSWDATDPADVDPFIASSVDDAEIVAFAELNERTVEPYAPGFAPPGVTGRRFAWMKVTQVARGDVAVGQLIPVWYGVEKGPANATLEPDFAHSYIVLANPLDLGNEEQQIDDQLYAAVEQSGILEVQDGVAVDLYGRTAPVPALLMHVGKEEPEPPPPPDPSTLFDPDGISDATDPATNLSPVNRWIQHHDDVVYVLLAGGAGRDGDPNIGRLQLATYDANDGTALEYQTVDAPDPVGPLRILSADGLTVTVGTDADAIPLYEVQIPSLELRQLDNTLAGG